MEFRPRIDLLASRLEDNNLEVALFGRVSSGKSSLLNALLSTDVLPGWNQSNHGSSYKTPDMDQCCERLWHTVMEEMKTSLLKSLRSVITEQGNPGNLRNVVRAMVEVPSPRLREGIVLVDTPGLGSLARRGAAETLAYLPSCDLASAPDRRRNDLNEEDIGTLRLLYEAAIPAHRLAQQGGLAGGRRSLESSVISRSNCNTNWAWE